MSDKLNRREFLLKLSALGLGAIGAGTLMNACGKKEEPAPETEQPAMEETADPCSDLTGLTEEEKQLRVTFEYVAKSTFPDKHCTNCGFWIEPEAGAPCGGCKVIKGPINPAGYCKSWVAKPTT